MFSFSVGVFGVASRSCSFPSSIRELFSDAILKSLSLASRAKRLVLFQDAAPPKLAVSAEYQMDSNRERRGRSTELGKGQSRGELLTDAIHNESRFAQQRQMGRRPSEFAKMFRV